MSPDTTSSLVVQLAGTALALAAVLLLAWVALRLLKRLHERTPAGGAGPPLQVLRTLGVGPRERLLVVRWRERQLLLGVTATTISMLASAEIGSEPSLDEPSGAP